MEHVFENKKFLIRVKVHLKHTVTKYKYMISVSCDISDMV